MSDTFKIICHSCNGTCKGPDGKLCPECLGKGNMVFDKNRFGIHDQSQCKGHRLIFTDMGLESACVIEYESCATYHQHCDIRDGGFF